MGSNLHSGALPGFFSAAVTELTASGDRGKGADFAEFDILMADDAEEDGEDDGESQGGDDGFPDCAALRETAAFLVEKCVLAAVIFGD